MIVIGAQLGATTLEFGPQNILPGNYSFAIGSAGSTGLVLQTVLPLLARMGVQVDMQLIRPGFFPAGGGRLEVHITPAPPTAPDSVQLPPAPAPAPSPQYDSAHSPTLPASAPQIHRYQSGH